MEKEAKAGGIIKEFREFAMRGNVIDLAVGVIIGGAFGKITASVVNDVLMPFIGMFIGGLDFSKLVIILPDIYNKGGQNLLKIGSLISTVIDFTIIAFVIFIMVKALNTLKEIQDKKNAVAEEKKPAEQSDEIKLLTEIRDLLKEKRV
jgi:large conductance mechanosensitive channel